MTTPVCPHCDDLADHPDAITCPTCGYYPLRPPTPAEAFDRRLARRPIRITKTTTHKARTT